MPGLSHMVFGISGRLVQCPMIGTLTTLPPLNV